MTHLASRLRMARGFWPLAALMLLIPACTGTKTQLPNYGQPATTANAPRTGASVQQRSRQYDSALGPRDVGLVVSLLSQSVLQPDMCRVVQCPRGGGYAVEIFDEDVVNAATDGETIFVARGLLDFVDNQGELAAVLAHEIAHGLLDHSSSKQQDAILGAMLGATLGTAVGIDATNLGANLGALTYSKEYEREADYVGLYILARAGFNLRDAYTMWQRMAGISQSQGTFLDSHPAFSERLALLRATNDEIAYKIQTGQPLVPAVR